MKGQYSMPINKKGWYYNLEISAVADGIAPPHHRQADP